jgi:hypothetical protein
MHKYILNKTLCSTKVFDIKKSILGANISMPDILIMQNIQHSQYIVYTLIYPHPIISSELASKHLILSPTTSHRSDLFPQFFI